MSKAKAEIPTIEDAKIVLEDRDDGGFAMLVLHGGYHYRVTFDEEARNKIKEWFAE